MERRLSMYLFIEYPKCSTCKKAKKFLDDNNIKYEDRNIVTDNPSKEELEKFLKLSGKDVKSFFNTSGNLYKELHLKDKIDALSMEEACALLATDGMLIKRPILLKDNQFVTIGYKEDTYERLDV